MNENEPKQKEKKSRKKIDKSQIAVKIVATFLTLAMLFPIVASAILYIVGDWYGKIKCNDT